MSQAVVKYYPFDGKRETRPKAGGGEEADDSIISRVFWQGRLVPESHISSLYFFPAQRL